MLIYWQDQWLGVVDRLNVPQDVKLKVRMIRYAALWYACPTSRMRTKYKKVK